MLKKRKALSLAGLLSLSLLVSACQGGGAPAASAAPAQDANGQTEQAAPAVQSGGDSAAAGGVAPEGEFPIVSEKIEMSVMVPNQASVVDFNTNTFTQYYEDMTNIHINWNVIPGDSVADRVNISLSSGDMPDVYLFCNISQSQQLVYGSQGAFQPLNGYIDQYGSFFTEIMGAIPNLEDVLTMSDGNIYALPHIEKCPHCEVSNKLWVNRDWITALNMEPPTTVEGYEEMLRAFKEQDPNGNGLADEVPLMTFEQGWNSSILTGALMNPFIYTQPDKFISLDEGNVVSAYTQDGWKDAMVWLNKLYNEGLYYDQSLVSNQDQARRVAQGGQDGAAVVGSFVGGVPSMVPGDLAEQWSPYVVLPPLEGQAGRFATWDAYNQINPTMFVITSLCKNPEAAFRWGAEQYTKDISYRRAFGVEGVNWKKVVPGEDGVPADAVDLRSETPSEILVFADGIPWGDPQDFAWRGAGLRCDSPDFPANRYAQYQPGDYETDMEYRISYDTIDYMEPYRPDISRIIPPLVYSEQQGTEPANIEAVVLAYVKEMGARFITGDADAAAEWDAYIAELENKGTSRLVEIYQEAYDAKYKQ